MLHALLTAPHATIHSRPAAVLALCCVGLLVITVHAFLTASQRRMAWFLGLAALFVGLAGLDHYSAAHDPPGHPAARTARLDSAAGRVGILAIGVFLLSWRRLQDETGPGG